MEKTLRGLKPGAFLLVLFPLDGHELVAGRFREIPLHQFVGLAGGCVA